MFEVQENEIIVVWDGTYIYIQKSSDYSFAKKTFSIHKNRPLIKMMVIVSTTGYIIEALGPYLANGANNDASITEHIMKDNEVINNFFEKNDKFIVDRGLYFPLII